MKKGLYILIMALEIALLCACGETADIENKNTVAETNKGKPADYVVNIDDSFNSGIEIDDTRKTLSPEESDFRNLKWGMTMDEVAYAQGGGYSKPQENIMYYLRLREEGFPADAEYTFKDEKLVQGIFFISQDKTEEAIEIADYVELVESLKERFGEPQIADLVFSKAEDKTEDTAVQLELVKNGKLQFRTGWLLDDTELRVVMFTRNGEACIGLQYKQAGAEIE